MTGLQTFYLVGSIIVLILAIIVYPTLKERSKKK